MPRSPAEEQALALDAHDPLRHTRQLFHIPRATQGGDAVYLCGNSLGLQPRAVHQAMAAELDDWKDLAVEGHFKPRDNWYRYHELCREPGARLVGALPHEVVMMNSLTVNLHLLMLSFYRPEPRAGGRRAILIERPCFPSDVYAVKSQLRLHGVPEEDGLVWLQPRPGEACWRTEDALELLERRGRQIAMVMLAGVNFVTGQLADIPAITRAAHAQGCLVGWDLAHAAGNVPLALHDWGVDFAVWCSYKYLNAGPGAVAGCFVHEKHTRGAAARGFAAMPRLEGWWGNDPDLRFQMSESFNPMPSADAWQLSNPPILSMVPLKVSLEIFDRAGMHALREKSLALTGLLERTVLELSSERLHLLTPSDPRSRGAQLSIRVTRDADALLAALAQQGVVCDLRRPDVIRVAPAPLYNTFHDVWRFGQALGAALK